MGHINMFDIAIREVVIKLPWILSGPEVANFHVCWGLQRLHHSKGTTGQKEMLHTEITYLPKECPNAIYDLLLPQRTLGLLWLDFLIIFSLFFWSNYAACGILAS